MHPEMVAVIGGIDMDYTLTKRSAGRLAKKLGTRRSELQVTVEELCSRSGLERYQIEYLESGQARAVVPEDLRAVAIALGGIADELYEACGWDSGERRTKEILESVVQAKASAGR